MAYQNIISVSGGKDSTAMLILAVSRGMDFRAVFADTGNEHEITVKYLEYLEKTLGIKIERYKADFSSQIAKKKENLKRQLIELSDCGRGNRRLKKFTAPMIERMLENLNPTGNPFLDLCIWKGRFPASQSQFCTEELKSLVITYNVMLPALNKANDDRKKVISWQGIRADESRRRSKLTHSEVDELCIIYRPIIDWTAKQVFALHKKHGIDPNPLYKMGMNRVGCMPCVNASKNELAQIDLEAQQHIEKIEHWEQTVAAASKRGKATFFQVGEVPGWPKELELIDITTHGIRGRVEYAKTSRGGRQSDWVTETREAGICRSNYGLCE